MRKALITLTLAVVLIITLLSACTVTSPGDELTEVKDFADFRNLEIGSAFEAEITQSETYSVIITADESLIDLVEVTKTGDTLKIYLNPRHIFTDFTIGAKTLRAVITMPALDSLELSGATKGTVSGFSSTGDFDLVVSGASALDELDIMVGNAEFEVSGASKVSGNISANDLEFEVSGASSIELSGTVDDITLEVSGASRVDMTDIPVNDADVSLSGASEATINVGGKLDIKLSGASRLYFYGNPTMGDTEVSGASTIKHK